MADLDGRAVEAYRRRAVGSRRLPQEVAGKVVESLVENLNLRKRRHLERAAAVLFHPSPELIVPDAYVKIGYLRS